MKNLIKDSRGYSLLELMITLGIFGVVVALAFPGFQGMITGQRLKTQTNDTLAAILMAKSEAIKRRSSITLCAMKTGIDNQCGTSGIEWSNGWIIFDDLNADGIINSGEEILKSKGDYDELTSKSTISAITLDEQGAANTSLDSDVCYSEAKGKKARLLAMAAIGSPSVTSKPNCS